MSVMAPTVISIIISCAFALWLLLYGDRVKKRFIQRRIKLRENLLSHNDNFLSNLVVLVLLGVGLMVASLAFGFGIAFVVYFSWPQKSAIPFYDTVARYLILAYLGIGTAAWWGVLGEMRRTFISRDKVQKELESLKTEIPKPAD